MSAGPDQHDTPRWDDDEAERSVRSARAFGALALGCALIAVVALGVAAVLVAGDPDPATSSIAPASAEPTSRQDALLVSYRRRANRICADALRVDELLSADSAGQLSAVIRLSLDASVRPTVNELADLEPPDRFQAEHDEMIAAGEAQIEVLEELILQLDSGMEPRDAALSAASRLDSLQKQSNRSYEVMGIEECLSAESRPSPERTTSPQRPE